MTETTISGVIVTPLKIISDDRGAVMHMLRADQAHFQTFGEIYFSAVNPGVIKAWKRHREMTLNLAVVSGSMRLAIYDDRPDSPTRGQVQDLEIGPAAQYLLVTVPPRLWYGFACVGDAPALMANCATIPHDPAETDGLPIDTNDIPFDWT
jgi:dTDP-4-dehydrorhamnose 3,5-epimerase